jgi:hypothetical protein
LGIGDWGLGPIPNPQSPIPNPQSPIPKQKLIDLKFMFSLYLKYILLNFDYIFKLYFSIHHHFLLDF